MTDRAATPESLQAVVAALMGMEPAAVSPDLALTGSRLQGSLARTRLYVTIEERLGVACQAAYTARTYGELHAAVFGQRPGGALAPISTARAVSPADARENGARPGLACGIDIEMVASLPVAADYWSEAFYRATFTPAEIAYCLLQERPLPHFAARWCAKEALKKCDPAYLAADLRTLEVASSPDGMPYLCAVTEGRSTPLPFVVSLSHTPELAVAVVVKAPPGPGIGDLPLAGPAAMSVAPPARGDVGSRGPSAWLPILMGGAALALAVLALMRTL
jgi:phosphopantetheine--protein transferase-like protein